MPGYQDIRIQLTCQQYVSDTPRIDEGKKLIELPFHSAMEAKDVRCPLCHGRVQVHDHGTLRLKDMPLFPGYEQVLEMSFHRWKCRECGHEFNEGVPLKADGARVTDRAARWVATLLLHRLTIAGVSRITGIHWSTVKRLHGRLMGRTLESRRRELEESGYRPTLLAVDEFAVHKGHTYATSVMDLGSGEVLWVGPGRGMADFEKFFHDMDMRLLERVEAVAMDMNASYNRLVERHMPWAEVVYDRYHMQAQYGKDVMGQVRLDEARAHREKAEALLGEAAEEPERGGRRALKAEARREKALYRELKGSRWLMLKGRGGLCEAEKDALGSILEDHQALALCHAMKEELSALFDLRDEQAAREGWTRWFQAAKESGIPPLMDFARLKEKRIEGLVAHSRHPIGTGRLEGFNNKIKVAKRIAYGYRDDGYFFTLIRYLSLPSSKFSSPKKT